AREVCHRPRRSGPRSAIRFRSDRSSEYAARSGVGAMKSIVPFMLACCLAVSAQAQAQGVSQQEADAFSIRGVGLASFQQFAANTTFDAAFGESSGQFFGGGVLIAEHGVFVELTVSHFQKTGQRAFLFNGTVFPLNIPLTATVTPVEVTAGYRFYRR